MHQRTMKVTITSGLMPDLMLRIDSELAPMARTAPGFVAYFAAAADETTLFTTRIFLDRASLQAETQAASEVSEAIASEFGFSDLETIVDAPIGVTRAYGPIEEFTP